jgi:amino acid adenylation domain-containing protein
MSRLRYSKSKRLRPVRGEQSQVRDDLIGKFLDHVKSSPDNIAIMTTDRSLTYHQLYIDVIRWKTLFSQHLHGRTIICLERTPRLLSVLLALQWLEITYIPVDFSIPIERLRTIIEDSQVQALLFDSASHPDYATLPCLQLDLANIDQLPPNTSDDTHTKLPKQKAIAYIIYTSGSTGKPKGVAISRSALNNFLASMSRYFLKEEHALLLAATTIAFDIAALELYLPLWQKKTVFLANQEQHKDPFKLATLLNDHPVTLLQATPSMWKMLEAVEWTGKSELVALCGGELLTQTLAQRLLTEVAELWNMYGPTEATVWCSLKQIQPNEPITIGRPIDNTEMRVMDALHHILPPYVKGELFIGGLCLAEGYVNNDTETKKRFIACDDALYGRLYRVGDIACITPDNEFIIFGRIDNQIKLHGYRIELEDIEAHIQQLPNIRECAITVYHEQLIAYLCLSDPAIFSEKELINHLAADLPEYMLPKRVILLDKLPLSTSGKIDRKALPPPTLSTTTGITEVTELTPMQLSLIRIWAEELGVPTVGIHDNFFELGGHSLLAARITSRILQQLGKQITLNDFYHIPTVVQLAEVVERAKDSKQPDGVKKKKNFVNRRWLPLNDFQLILWFSKTFEPRLKKYNVVARKRVQGPLNKIALDRALQLVFQKHEILSYTINPFFPAQRRKTGWWLQWIETPLFDCDDEICEAVLSKSFDELFYHQRWRTNAPMIAAKLFYLQHDQVELQICMSHLIGDENSFAIFFHDLSNAYLYYAHHTILNAKESLQSFKSYVLEQNDIMAKYADIDAAFWTQYLQDAGLFPFSEKFIVQDIEKQQIPFSTYIEIPELLLTKLRQFCIQNHVTLSDVLCAAIGLSLRVCCENEIALPHKLFMSTVKSTRDDPNYDNVMGCFLRIHPIKLDLNEGKTLSSLAKQVQRSTLETTEYQRASSLVKLASIGQIPYRKRSLKTFSLSLATAIFSKLFQRANLHTTILKASSILASAERKNNFLINVNIFNNFFSDISKQQTLFGLSNQTIPLHPYAVNLVNNVFDVCFLRDQDRPFVVISSNLTSTFREYFGKTFLEIIQQELDLLVLSNPTPRLRR